MAFPPSWSRTLDNSGLPVTCKRRVDHESSLRWVDDCGDREATDGASSNALSYLAEAARRSLSSLRLVYAETRGQPASIRNAICICGLPSYPSRTIVRRERPP